MKRSIQFFFLMQVVLCVSLAQIKPDVHLLVQGGQTTYTADRFVKGIELGIGVGLDYEDIKVKEYLPAVRTAKITLNYLSVKETNHDSISLKRIELDVYINRNYGINDNLYFYFTGGVGFSYYYFKNEKSSKLSSDDYDSKMGLPFGLGLGFDIYVGPLSFYVEDKFKIDLVANNYFTWKGTEFRLSNFAGAGIRVRVN